MTDNPEPPPLTEADQVAALMAAYGVDEDYARFILAIERGESDGDVIEEAAS